VYTYNDFRFDDDSVYGNNALAGVPEQLYVSEVRLDGATGWYLGVNVRVVPDGPWVDFSNTTRVPGYTLWGVTAGWDVTDHVRLFVAGENLTDKAYVSNIGTNADQSRERAALFTPGQGRGCFGGISVRI
jgi:iron complex outermembrane receptor protein